jgi:hypothetical protein
MFGKVIPGPYAAAHCRTEIVAVMPSTVFNSMFIKTQSGETRAYISNAAPPSSHS